jgi:predicted dienelactone hydrolase
VLTTPKTAPWRWQGKVLAVAVALVAWSLAGPAGAGAARPLRAARGLPDASPGQFRVGHATLSVPAAGELPALSVDVWYPSKHAPGPKATYELRPGVDIPARLAVDGATPAPGRFPLVVYSHGSGGFSVVATFFTEALASHGYVVAAPNHPGDTIIDAYLRTVVNGTDALSDAALAALVTKRIGDLPRVITGVLDAPPSTAGYARSIDRRRVVLAGHSLGGAAAIGAAAADPRVRAVIAMDPTWNMLTPDQLARVKVPVLTMWSNVGLSPGARQYDTLKRVRYGVTFPTATHAGFTDLCSYQSLAAGWAVALGQLGDIRSYLNPQFAQTCRPPTLSSTRLHRLVDGYSMAFLRLVLFGERSWLATLQHPRPDTQIQRLGTLTRTRPPSSGGSPTTTPPTLP